MAEEEEEEQFLFVEDDRMEDVIILSEPSSETEWVAASYEYSNSLNTRICFFVLDLRK